MVSKPKAPKRSKADIEAEEAAKIEREKAAEIEAQKIREQEAKAQGRRSLVSGISGGTGVREEDTSLF